MKVKWTDGSSGEHDVITVIENLRCVEEVSWDKYVMNSEDIKKNLSYL